MESDKPRLNLWVFVANMALGGRDVFQRRTRSPSSSIALHYYKKTLTEADKNT